VVNRVNLVNFP